MVAVLDNAWTMLGRWGACQGSWPHPQPHSTHTQLLPWCSDQQNFTSTRWWSCLVGIIRVWIYYQTMTWMLDDEQVMSDRFGTCQGLWLHLQPHSGYAQTLPWFSIKLQNCTLTKWWSLLQWIIQAWIFSFTSNHTTDILRYDSGFLNKLWNCTSPTRWWHGPRRITKVWMCYHTMS